MVKKGATDIERLEAMMVTIFAKHFSNLVHNLETYEIQNPKHRILIRKFLETLREDCDVFMSRMQEHHDLANHAKGMKQMVMRLEEAILSHEATPDNIRFIRRLKDELTPYYEALRIDLSRIIENEDKLIHFIDQVEKAA